MLNCRVRMDEVKAFLPALCTASIPKRRVNTDKPSHRVGYTLIYCAYQSGVVEYFVQKALVECLEVKLTLEYLITRNNPKQKSGIKLCSIGGGPGADVVGAMLGFTFFAYKNMLMSVSVIENRGAWRCTFNTLIKCLKIGCLRLLPREIFDKRAIFQLKQANFLKPLSSSIEEVIKVSNIILMFEFSSMYPEDSVQCAMENIMKTIEIGSLIFFLDSSAKFTELIDTQWSDYGHILYGPLRIKYCLPYVPKVLCELYGYGPQVHGAHLCMVLQKTRNPTDLAERTSYIICNVIDQLIENILMDSININFNIMAQWMHS